MSDDRSSRPDASRDRTHDSRNDWDTNAYDDGHSFVYEYGEDLLDHLHLGDDDRVLDLGCGTGHLTRQIAEQSAFAVGIDASEEMIAKAKTTQTHSDLAFLRADVRAIPLEESFDAVLSNAVLHWVDEADHDDVLADVRDVLRPGGRFVAELGGRGNVESVVETVRREAEKRGREIQNRWYFPTIGEYASRLESHGFEVEYAVLFDRPTSLDGGEEGLAAWFQMFGDGLMSSLSTSERDQIVEATEQALRPERFRDGSWVLDYRRLRFVARRT